MYTLKKADRSHKHLGTSNGVLGPGPAATFWIIGWSPTTLEQVSEERFYTLEFPDGQINSVEVKQIDQQGGRIRFEFTG